MDLPTELVQEILFYLIDTPKALNSFRASSRAAKDMIPWKRILKYRFSERILKYRFSDVNASGAVDSDTWRETFAKLHRKSRVLLSSDMAITWSSDER